MELLLTLANNIVPGSKELGSRSAARRCQFSSPERPQPPPSSLPAAGTLSAPRRSCRRAPDVALPGFAQRRRRRPLLPGIQPSELRRQRGGIRAQARDGRRRRRRPPGETSRAPRQGEQTGRECPDLLESHCLAEDYYRRPSLKPSTYSRPCYTCNHPHPFNHLVFILLEAI